MLSCPPMLPKQKGDHSQAVEGQQGAPYKDPGCDAHRRSSKSPQNRTQLSGNHATRKNPAQEREGTPASRRRAAFRIKPILRSYPNSLMRTASAICGAFFRQNQRVSQSCVAENGTIVSQGTRCAK